MADRKWHLEHADGREWTKDELDARIGDIRRNDHCYPFDGECHDVCISTNGTIYLIDDGDIAWKVGRDMRAVCDE